MKMTIYQVMTRLWGNGKMSDFDECTFSYLKTLGVSHVWYTGIIRHASGKSFVKGDPGSPYAISCYYDVNPYLADNEYERINEFEDLVKRTHAAGLKVVIDFVPNHVARDYSDSQGGIRTFDWCDFDWSDTVKIDYGFHHSETWTAMRNILAWWLSKGVDGFRCDMVELVPSEFFSWVIGDIKRDYPDAVFIAEVYHKDNYRKYVREVGFDYLYDKSGLYDALSSIVRKNVSDQDSPVYLWQSTRNITWNWQFLGDLQSCMLNFLENHDEQRIASDYMARSADNTYAALYASMLFNTAPFMIYAGQEVGERAMSEQDAEGRTSIFDFVRIDSLKRLYKYIHGSDCLDSYQSRTLKRYREVGNFASSALIESGLVYDLCYCNENSQGFDIDCHFAFLRHYGDETVLFFCNFSAHDASVDTFIPSDAFVCFGMEDAGDKRIGVRVPAFDAVAVRI